MKWPQQLTLIRHGESAYNELKKRKWDIPGYKEFIKQYDSEWSEDAMENVKNVLSGKFPSEQLKAMALELAPQLMLQTSDYDTPLTEKGIAQSKSTGAKLKEHIGLPDVIYLSPYLRTKQTLAATTEGWSELKEVPVIEEERIREQEHGMKTLYNDNRIYNVFHPKNALLDNLQDHYSNRNEGGESQIDVRDRVGSFINTLIREYSNQKVLLITHHLLILALMGKLERWSREEFIQTNKTSKPVNCGVTIFQGDAEVSKSGKLLRKEYNLQLFK